MTTLRLLLTRLFALRYRVESFVTQARSDAYAAEQFRLKALGWPLDFEAQRRVPPWPSRFRTPEPPGFE